MARLGSDIHIETVADGYVVTVGTRFAHTMDDTDLRQHIHAFESSANLLRWLRRHLSAEAEAMALERASAQSTPSRPLA